MVIVQLHESYDRSNLLSILILRGLFASYRYLQLSKTSIYCKVGHSEICNGKNCVHAYIFDWFLLKFLSAEEDDLLWGRLGIPLAPGVGEV